MAAVAALALVGCGPKEIQYKVKAITQSCDPRLDPFQGAQMIRVRVLGDQLDPPLEVTSPVNATSREIKIPQIPAGPGLNRVVEIRAYDGDPVGGGKVLSVGRSAPFEVPDVIPENFDGKPIEISVFLRKVNAFSPPSTSADPRTCQKLTTARAGHTATLLQNGKVFIAGGYNIKQGVSERQALADTELFDPTTGTFVAGPPMGVSGTTRLPKAFHTATLLNNGQVLLWGGEEYIGANNLLSTKSIHLVYDAKASTMLAAPAAQGCGRLARTRHGAAMDLNGKVLLVGGVYQQTGTTPQLQDKVEWFDPDNGTCSVMDGFTFPRKDLSVTAVLNGGYIGVAGGSDATQLKTEVVFFRYDNGKFNQVPIAQPPQLREGRRLAAVSLMGADQEFMVLSGGYGDAVTTKPLASSELVKVLGNGSVAPGPTVGTRGEVCSVRLNDGTVMAIGGLTTDSPGSPPRSDGSTVVIRMDKEGGVQGLGGPALATPRYSHTCTLLPDGSVLVLGGVNELDGTRQVLSDAWIYTPAPID